LRDNAMAVAVVHTTSFHPSGLDRVGDDTSLPKVKAVVKAANQKALVVPAVIDDELAADPRGVAEMKRLLLNQKNGKPGDVMKEHVAALVKLASPYDGLAVDYEFTFDSLRGDTKKYRDGFTVFIRELRDALPSKLVLAVAVKARTGPVPGSPAQAVYDYRAIGQVADLVEVLAYDHSWATSNPGDIAPKSWVRSVASYTRAQLAGTGADPVLLIGSYGYDWPVDAEGRRTGRGKALTATDLTRLPRFSPDATNWTYDNGGQLHEVYQITASAMRTEVQQITKPNKFRAGFWSAAESDPEGWAKIRAALE